MCAPALALGTGSALGFFQLKLAGGEIGGACTAVVAHMCVTSVCGSRGGRSGFCVCRQCIGGRDAGPIAGAGLVQRGSSEAVHQVDCALCCQAGEALAAAVDESEATHVLGALHRSGAAVDAGSGAGRDTGSGSACGTYRMCARWWSTLGCGGGGQAYLTVGGGSRV